MGEKGSWSLGGARTSPSEGCAELGWPAGCSPRRDLGAGGDGVAVSAVPASAGGYDLRNYMQKERGIGLVLTGVQIKQRRRAGVAAMKLGGGAL